MARKKPTKAEIRRNMYNDFFAQNGADEESSDYASFTSRKEREEAAAAEQRKSFNNVKTGSSTYTPSAGRTSLDRSGDAFTGGLADVASDFMYQDVDASAREKLRRAAEEKRIQESSLPEPLARIAHTDLLSRGGNYLGGLVGDTEAYQSGMKGLSKYSDEKRKAVEMEVNDMMERNPVRGFGERMVLDVLGSPQSLASIPGGAMAAIPAMTTYNDAYRRMREGGASPEAAKDYATKQAGIEGAISAIPAGQVFKTIAKPFVKAGAKPITTGFQNTIPDLLKRTIRTGAGESVEEMTQQVAQDMVNRVGAVTGDDKKAREIAAQAISKDLFNDTIRAGAAGFAGGNAFGGVHSYLQIAKENAEVAARANYQLNADLNSRERMNAANVRNKVGDLQRDTSIDVDKMNSLLLPAEQVGAARQKLNTVNSRIEQTKQELAEIKEQEYRHRMAEESGEPVGKFDTVRKARAGQSLVNLELAKNKLTDMLRQHEQGTAMQQQLTAQERAAEKAAFDAAPGTNKNLALASVGNASRVKPPSKKKVAQDAAEAARKAQEAELRAFANGGTTQTQETPAGPSAARQLVQRLTKNVGTADAKRALHLLASGRLEIVNDLSEIGHETPEGMVTKGIERDGKIYINAAAFDPKQDLAPQLAATVFHETKHAADFGEGDVNIPKNLAGFIGMENSTKINRKIEQAAERGNKLAQLAVERAEASSNYEEELVPHFISESKLARNKASGMGNVMADIRNGVKSQYNRLFGNSDGVSVDDVFKLSEKLTDYVAQNSSFNTQPKEQVAPGRDREMLISGGTNADLALKEGRSYLSADGKRKYEIDDSKSRMLIPGDMQRGKTYKAKDILAHDELYKELPELKDVNVRFEDAGDLFGAYYDSTNNTIVLNDKFIGPNSNDFNSRTHQYMIHEMQHAAQQKSGSTNGASPEDFLSPEDRKIQQNIQNTKGAISFANEIKMPKDQLYDLQDKLLDLESDFEGRMEVATKKYKKVLGEQEAYSTANRLPLTQKERLEDTTDVGRNLEQRFLAQEGELLSERGKRIASKDRQMAVPSNNGEIAQDRKGTGVKALKTIKGLFSAFGELGRDLGVRAEEAVGEASYFNDIAQTTSQRITRGTALAASRLVKEGKATSLKDAKAKIDARIKGTLDSLISIEEEPRRQSAIAALVREHPELSAIQDGYNTINDGTRQIVKQMLASKTGPLTDAEIKKMKTLINEQTRYLTRAYAAFQGADGKTWASKLQNEYAIVKALVAEGKAVPSKHKDSYERYKNALDFVIRENVAVFDEEELGKMTLDKVRMVYDTWFSNRQGVEDEFKRESEDKDAKVKDHLIEAIVAKGEQVNAKQIENRAHKIVNGLLGLNETNNPLVTYYRGFKQDRSILMDRQKLPDELKDLFGEIQDPAMRIMLTIAKQGELVARTNLLLGIKNDLYGKKIVSNEDKADDANDTFSQQLSGTNWGPLEGHWVTPEVWSTIRDDREIATNMEDAIGRLVLDANAVNSKWPVKAASYYTRLAGLQKVAAIVWNPAQTIWNFGGSWISGIKEGNINPKNYVRAGKAAAKLFAKEMQAAGVGGRILENDPDVEDLIRYDVIDSAMVQEIRKLPSQYIRQIINDHGQVRNALTKTKDVSFAAVKQIFALSDLTVKIANYYNEVNHLTAYYQAEGITKSPEAIKKEAANTIKDTNITFRRAAPIVKMAERAGMTYVLPYIQGVFRSAIYGYVHGMKSLIRGVNEAKTVKGKALMAKQGFGRIMGSITAMYLIQAMAKSVLTGDDEKDKKIRQIQMLDARYADSTYVGDDAKGNPMMLRWSRFDPLGPLTDLIRIVSSDATDEQKNRDMMQHMHDLIIKPRLGQELLKLGVEFVTDDKEAAVKTKETKLERIFPQATQETKDFFAADFMPTDYADAQAFMGVLDTMLPGASNIIDPNNVSPKDWKAKDADEAVAKFLLAMGGRLDTINPVTSAFGAVKDLDSVRKEARERVFEKLKTTDPTDRDAMKGIMNLMDDERKAFIRVKEVYEGMQALDMSKAEIDEVLSDRAGLSAHDRHLLYSGKYDTSLEGWKTNGSSVLSKKSLDPRTKTSGDKKPDPKDAAKEKEAIKKAVKALQALGYKVKE